MFTLLVLWLLVACIPGLLMLATLGLGRLEKALAQDSVTSSDVAEFLDQAEPVDVRTLAREGMPEALEYLHRRQALGLATAPQPKQLTGRHCANAIFAADVIGRTEAGLPTRGRHVNRV